MDCSICDKQFRHKKNLYVHMRKIHKLEPDTGKAKILCPKCNANFTRYVHLRQHLWLQHEIQMKIETVQFKSVEEFYDWKKYKEKEMDCFYVCQAGTKSLKGGTGIKQYFVCHRSGNLVSKSPGQKSIRKQRSCKLNTSCPSTLLLTEINSIFEATLWTPHVGHSNDALHFKLMTEDKKAIADNIAEGDASEKRFSATCGVVRQADIMDQFLLINQQNYPNIGKNLDNTIQNPTNCLTSVECSEHQKANEGSLNPKTRIEEKLKTVMDLISKDVISESSLPVLEEMLDNCITFICENRLSKIGIETHNLDIQGKSTADPQIVITNNSGMGEANKNLVNQKTFHSSEKKKTTKGKASFNKTVSVKKENFEMGLTQEFVITKLDHTYIKI